jgi:hypothetical protein
MDAKKRGRTIKVFPHKNPGQSRELKQHIDKVPVN